MDTLLTLIFGAFLGIVLMLIWIKTLSSPAKKSDRAARSTFPLIRIWRDDSIPAFGGWAAGSLKELGEGVILLNVGTCLLGGIDEDGNRVEMTTEDSKWLLITTMMHEFGHACQEFFDLEFTEERIDQIVQDYEAGFRSGKYNARHANDGNPPS